MGVLDESECQFLKISDRLKALQENSVNKWQQKSAISEEFSSIRSLKERRQVFAAANATTENKGAKLNHTHIPVNRRNHKPLVEACFQTVKLTKRAVTEHVDDKSSVALSPKNRRFIKDAIEVRNDVVRTHDFLQNQTTPFLNNRCEVGARLNFIKTTFQQSEVMQDEKPSYLLSTAKRSVPRPNRRLPTRYQNAAASTQSKSAISFNSKLHLETEDKENREEETIQPKRPNLRVSSAVPFQAPIVGQNHCGVQLRHVDRSSPFPEPMLIRALCIGKNVDLRLINPIKTSVSEQGSYLLVTAKKMIIRNGKEANVQERSKIARLALQIIAGKEMFEYSGKPELANEEGLAEASFWRNLNGADEEKENSLSVDEYQKIYSKSFAIYRIEESGKAIEMQCEVVSASVLDSTQILVLDFGSEIYIWSGRRSNRSLAKFATEFVEKLKSTPMPSEMSSFVRLVESEQKRPSWILCRRLSEGIADSLFLHKFELDSSVPKPAFSRALPHRSEAQTVKIPASFYIKKTLPTTSYSYQLKDEDSLARELAKKFAEFVPSTDCFMELEDTKIRPFDPNVFTEKLNFFVLNGETLDHLNEQPREFDCRHCYVIEWRYRVEKAVRKLNHEEAKKHDTGRERGVYFYWLGQLSTVKEQSFCALALRNKNRERLENIRLEQGREHPLFISLLGSNKFIVSGTSTNTFLFCSYNQDNSLVSMVETRGQTGRSQTATAKIIDGQLLCQRGEDCPQNLWENAQQLAIKLAFDRQLQLKCSETMEFDCFRPHSWSSPPRFYRIYEMEGDVLFKLYSQFTFPARQSDLNDDGCTLIENGDSLYIWSGSTVSTFALKVAKHFWSSERKKEQDALVVYKGNEPLDLMALFCEWKEDVEDQSHKHTESLASLLTERTRYRSIKEILERRLPDGCDLKNLEQYLSDEDFESLFKMTRSKFQEQPKWKQTAMKKQTNLF